MEYFSLFTNPTYTQGEAQAPLHLTIITDLEKFQAENGEFRANQLKATNKQTGFVDNTYTLTVYVDTEGKDLTVKQIQGAITTGVLKAQAAKIDKIDITTDVELTPLQLGVAYYSVCQVNYKFEVKKIEENRTTFLKNVNFVGVAQEHFETADFKFYKALSDGKIVARDFGNGRVNFMNTITIAQHIEDFVKLHPEVEIKKLVGEEVKNEGLLLHYSVGMGSRFPPTFINLKYTGNPDSDEYHALVGKGVIFDTGGTNVKRSLLGKMYMDKGGASSVFGAFHGVVSAGLKVNLTASIPLAENALDGNSYRTSDIIKSYNGKTVEIINTDAEGRLLLADALAWTQKHYKIATIIDLATLTGSAMRSLGHYYAAILTDHDELKDQLIAAGAKIDENLWQLPLLQSVKDGLKSGPADVKNLFSASGYAGCIDGGCFLSNFIEEGVKWSHLDICGAFLNFKGRFGIYSTGATGFGVGVLMEYFRNLSA